MVWREYQGEKKMKGSRVEQRPGLEQESQGDGILSLESVITILFYFLYLRNPESISLAKEIKWGGNVKHKAFPSSLIHLFLKKMQVKQYFPSIVLSTGDTVVHK